MAAWAGACASMVRKAKDGTATKRWQQRLCIHGKRTWRAVGYWPQMSLGDAREQAMRNWLDNRDGKIAAAPARSKVPTSRRWRLRRSRRTLQAGASGREATTRNGCSTTSTQASEPSAWMLSAPPICCGCSGRFMAPTRATRPAGWSRSIFALAIAKGYGTANPCAEQLEAALPRKTKNGKHHDAVPHSKLGKHLDAAEGWIGARLALKFVALTACRTGEARNATWGEIDGVTWTIPAERAKTRTAAPCGVVKAGTGDSGRGSEAEPDGDRTDIPRSTWRRAAGERHQAGIQGNGDEHHGARPTERVQGLVPRDGRRPRAGRGRIGARGRRY